MARDFRPKGARSGAAAAAAAASPSTNGTPKPTPTKPVTTSSAPAKSTPSKPTPTKKSSKKKDAFDSEDSADEDTLMREIKSFGGSREDLELISKANAKSKSDVNIDEAAFSTEVAAFLKQLQSDPTASEPAAASAAPTKKQKQPTPAAAPASTTKPDSKKKNAPEAPTDKSQARKEKEDGKQKSKQENKPRQQAAVAAESTTAQRMGKGKKMVFDDDGVGKETKHKPSHTSRGPLRLEAVPHWMSQSLPRLPASGSNNNELGHDRITHLLDLGAELMRQEARAYDDLTSSETSLNRAGGSIGTLTASDAQFVRSLLSSEGGGTLSDRISALTLLVQSSPVHNVKHMDTLLAMTRKKSREEASRATRALADWLASEGGLGSRKLRYFRDQPQLSSASVALASSDVAAAEAAKSHLLLWAFEDHLKKFYFQFLQVLEVQSHDTIAFTRKQATTQVYILLRDKPEQEQNLLRLLVNKLGDPERSVASKTSNHILELLTAHPAMKFIVVREIANLILRPSAPTTNDEGKVANHTTHARYYGVLTLNQTVLTARDDATANHLILLYFELFEGILRQSEAKEAAGTAEEDVEEPKKKDKKRWKDQPRKGRGRKSKPAKSEKPEEPKLVKDAESKMVVAILTGVRRAFPFAKIEPAVFEKHVNTLFKILHTASFNVSIQALQLIFQLSVSDAHAASAVLASGAIGDRFYRVLYDSLLDARLAASSKQAMYLNLVFQALQADADAERVKAFVKRLCQILSLHQPSFICGCLHLLAELFRRTPGLRAMLTEPEDDDDEHFHDVDSDAEVDTQAPATAAAAGAGAGGDKYDGRKRDPRFARAGRTCLWDIVPLIWHFHPSVSVHALQIVQGSTVSTNADLSLNTLSHFLDRFVYRNPKQSSGVRGASAMQPLPHARVGAGVTRSRTHALHENEFVNTEAFWKQRADAVPADQLFFHRFFNLRSKQPSASRAHVGDDDALVDSDDQVAKDEEESELDSDDDADENEIWKVMKATMPGKEELEGLDDSDGEDDEFDYVDSESEAEAAEPGDAAEEEEDDSDDEEGPRVVPGMTFSDSDTGGSPAAGGDWEDDMSDDGGNLFDEDDDDLVPFTDFDSRKRSLDEPDEAKGKGKKRRKAVANLPTFASAEDYAHLLGDDE
ncbi:hypothetical protein PaG_04688 [Moesziomyces aphidis]|uniref:CCAAT-binding factor domain-containing protein n=1 Tax=Moesziomyces aphidis TaxID=84754 RepID=W3VGL4_MOEAP|nr:hypothetical protein PaG_04688 [Moesziomyces aphidis]